MYNPKAKIFSSEDRKLYGLTEHFKRPALWLVFLAIFAVIVLKPLDPRAIYESPVLLLSLNSVFIGIPSILIAAIAARGFLRSGSWATLWMGIGSMVFGLTMVLSSLILFWTTNAAEMTHNIGSLLTALLYVIGPLFVISNIPAQEIKPGRTATVVHVYLAVLIIAVIIAIIGFLGLFPAFFVQGSEGTLIRQVILGTAMLFFLLGGALLLRYHLQFKSELLYWYALGLLMMSLAMACRLMQTAQWTPLNWLGRGVQLVAGVYLLIAVMVTLREARARRVSMGEALASSFIWQETNLKLLFESIAEAIIVTDRKSNITGWNKTAENIYGWKEEEVTGKQMDEVLQTRYPSGGLVPDFNQTQGWKAEVTQKHKDGSERVILSSVSIFKDEIGKDSGLVAVNRDITARKRAEEMIARARDELEIKVKERTVELSKLNEDLSEANRFNSALLENSPIAIDVLESDGSIKYANPRFEKLLGYNPAEVLGRRPPFPWYPEEKSEDYVKMLQSVMNGEIVRGEKLFIKKSGEECWVDTILVPVIVKGETDLILASAVDITEQKRLRDELKLYSQRLTRIQEEERKHVAKELHEDIAQSLAILKLELEAIIDSGVITDENTLNKLVQLREDINRAVQDMRQYSYELRPGELDYLGLVASLDQLIEEINDSGSLEASFEVAGEEYKLDDDVELTLFRITQEALNNTRKHAQASEVKVNIRYLPKKIKLSISDNGKGFNLKGEAVSALKKGSLGIVGMRERAQLIGADFKIDSGPGKGTTITVELPRRG